MYIFKCLSTDQRKFPPNFASMDNTTVSTEPTSNDVNSIHTQGNSNVDSTESYPPEHLECEPLKAVDYDKLLADYFKMIDELRTKSKEEQWEVQEENDGEGILKPFFEAVEESYCKHSSIQTFQNVFICLLKLADYYYRDQALDIPGDHLGLDNDSYSTWIFDETAKVGKLWKARLEKEGDPEVTKLRDWIATQKRRGKHYSNSFYFGSLVTEIWEMRDHFEVESEEESEGEEEDYESEDAEGKGTEDEDDEEEHPRKKARLDV
jgi:hypothetical protein